MEDASNIHASHVCGICKANLVKKMTAKLVIDNHKGAHVIKTNCERCLTMAKKATSKLEEIVTAHNDVHIPEKEAAEAALQLLAANYVDEPADLWVCGQCTANNDVAKDKCRICYDTRPGTTRNKTNKKPAW